jgi:hypothetical protein
MSLWSWFLEVMLELVVVLVAHQEEQELGPLLES